MLAWLKGVRWEVRCSFTPYLLREEESMSFMLTSSGDHVVLAFDGNHGTEDQTSIVRDVQLSGAWGRCREYVKLERKRQVHRCISISRLHVPCQHYIIGFPKAIGYWQYKNSDRKHNHTNRRYKNQQRQKIQEPTEDRRAPREPPGAAMATRTVADSASS